MLKKNICVRNGQNIIKELDYLGAKKIEKVNFSPRISNQIQISCFFFLLHTSSSLYCTKRRKKVPSIWIFRVIFPSIENNCVNLVCWCSWIVLLKMSYHFGWLNLNKTYIICSINANCIKYTCYYVALYVGWRSKYIGSKRRRKLKPMDGKSMRWLQWHDQNKSQRYKGDDKRKCRSFCWRQWSSLKAKICLSHCYNSMSYGIFNGSLEGRIVCVPFSL